MPDGGPFTRNSRRGLGVCVLALLAACGQTAPAETSGGPDVQFTLDIQKNLDGVGNDGALSDGGKDQGSSALDETETDGSDAYSSGDGESDDGYEGGSDVSAPKCEFPADPQEGEAGAKCKVDSDCNSGLCVDGLIGKICSTTCFDCCPTGFACKPLTSNSGALVCQAIGLELCRPCQKDGQCQKNGVGALCVQYGDAGSFCGSACEDDSDCTPGYGCKLAKGEKGSAKQCMLLQGECTCSDDDIADAASTTCQVSNSFGACSATRTCGAKGLSACTAATPAAEVCGDGIDNDCNGKTDEVDAQGCTPFFPDNDQDGDGKAGSVGKCLCAATDLVSAATATDCDDKNAKINGKALEVCDGADNDCNGQTDDGCDGDGDGFCNSEKQVVGTPAICPKGNGDCNDGDAGIHPDQQEICGNGKDDDCDGLTDSGSNVSACVPFYQDGDGDGYGVGSPVCQCGSLAGYTATKGGDCNDQNAASHPGAAETCNGADDNCDGSTDEAGATGCTALYLDVDGDGFGIGASACLCAADKGHSAAKPGDCDDTAVSVSPAATETCNGKDDNCDGTIDEMGAQGCTTYYLDKDLDGFGDPTTGICLCGSNPLAPTTVGTDCNDDSAAAHPGAAEICDGLDNDCDGQTDEANATDCLNFYVDGDNDGVGNSAQAACLCAATADFPAKKGGDCDDANPAISPKAAELCDGIDNNCKGGIDEEDAVGCSVWARDHDGDGYGATNDSKCLCAKGGEYTAASTTDCDDFDKAIHPKAAEVCDGVDNDCDGKTDPAGSDGCNNWFVDKDGDGYGTYQAPSKCLCEGGVGFAAIGGDCNDGNAAVNPDATEVCNGIDDNCDQIADPANTSGCTVYYSDVDQDGYGVGNLLQCACSPEATFTATQGGDCKDTDASINPGTAEVCNSLDDNCNGQADEGLNVKWYMDGDKDGYGTGLAKLGCGASGSYTATQAGDCDDTKATTYPTAPELCNGLDDNCNGQTDEGGSATKYYLDSDGDGYGTGGGQILCGTSGGYTATKGGDCDDSHATVHPGLSEICDGLDNDCNGQTDDGLATGNYYKDLDGDGYGAGAVVIACSGTGYVSLNGDCNDNNNKVNPAAAEVCDGADNNCNSQVDELLGVSTYFQDMDKDGYGVGGGVSACGPLGNVTAIVGGDCDDGNLLVNPAMSENCSTAYDDNCDGQVNEGCTVCAAQMLNDFEATAGITANGTWYRDTWLTTQGTHAATFEDDYTPKWTCGYSSTPSGGSSLFTNTTIPTGALFVKADTIINNMDGSHVDSSMKVTLLLNNVPVVFGPFNASQKNQVKTATWPVAPAMWGQSVEFRAVVETSDYSLSCNAGVAVDNLRATCN